MRLEPRQFRPTLPVFRNRLTILFLGSLTILATVAWIRERSATPFFGLLAMTLAASWLYYRLRIVGAPTLDIDSRNVRYRVGKRETAASWARIARVQANYYRDEIHLIRNDGQQPIVFSIDMTSSTGERFDMVFDDYLRPPKRGG